MTNYIKIIYIQTHLLGERYQTLRTWSPTTPQQHMEVAQVRWLDDAARAKVILINTRSPRSCDACQTINQLPVNNGFLIGP